MKNPPVQFNNVIGGHCGFSAITIDNLIESEYTLASIVVDVSASVIGFESHITKMLEVILEGCKSAPTSQNIMIRTILFSDSISELHGFIPVGDIDASYYKNISANGMTALFDATKNGITSSLSYAKILNSSDDDYTVNSINIIITDGVNNRGEIDDPKDIKDIIHAAKRDEALESILTILIGLQDSQIAGTAYTNIVKRFLDDFYKLGELDEFIDAGKMSKDTFQKIAGFISRSISSQSQSLGTGGPSQVLTF